MYVLIPQQEPVMVNYLGEASVLVVLVTVCKTCSFLPRIRTRCGIRMGRKYTAAASTTIPVLSARTKRR